MTFFSRRVPHPLRGQSRVDGHPALLSRAVVRPVRQSGTRQGLVRQPSTERSVDGVCFVKPGLLQKLSQ